LPYDVFAYRVNFDNPVVELVGDQNVSPLIEYARRACWVSGEQS